MGTSRRFRGSAERPLQLIPTVNVSLTSVRSLRLQRGGCRRCHHGVMGLVRDPTAASTTFGRKGAPSTGLAGSMGERPGSLWLINPWRDIARRVRGGSAVLSSRSSRRRPRMRSCRRCGRNGGATSRSVSCKGHGSHVVRQQQSWAATERGGRNRPSC